MFAQALLSTLGEAQERAAHILASEETLNSND